METNYPKVKTKYWYLLFVFAIITVLVWIAVFSLRPDYQLHVNFYDVGQGEAIFIETMAGNQILIDGGPDSSVLQKLGQDLPFYDRTIDLIILTHPHADHTVGLIEVLKRYKVKKVMLTDIAYETQTYKRFLEFLEEKNIPTVVAYAGQRIILDDSTIMDILLPQEDISGEKIKNVNGTSIVARLSFGKTDFLFTGDATKANERALIDGGYNIGSEVLKVGHHGSRSSTGQEFLELVNPEYAVISVGEKNRYGHPHEETLEILSDENISILRTDEAGDIKMTSDGVTVKFLN